MSPLTLAVFLSSFVGIYSKEVQSVPGLKEKLNFRHYSGFIQVTETHLLHYWFVESQRNPSTAPVLLWMNGGPGCSSLVGFLTEIGPFLVNEDGKTVRLNPYSWNQDINILFLESPAGTGFSYSTNGNITTNDDEVAAQNYAALKIFFAIALPQYRKNDFYIAGQSYGGIYVPMLSKLIVDGLEEFELNLKGVLIGNGAVDWSLNMDTFVPFAYWHGILSQKDFTKLKKECCSGKCTDDCTSIRHKETDTCTATIGSVWNKLVMQKINLYDIYDTCYLDFKTSDWYFGTLFGVLPTRIARKLLKERQSSPQQTRVNSGYLCVDDRALIAYINQQDFRKALFIPAEAPDWNTCGDPIWYAYTKQYEDVGMFEQFKHILKAGIKVLMYYGDADAVCNYALAETFAEQLGFELKQPKQPWYYESQNAGFVTKYEGLDVYTIKGAGHMSPQGKKPELLQLVNEFVNGL